MGYKTVLGDVWSFDTDTGPDDPFHKWINGNAPCDGSVVTIHVRYALRLLPVVIPMLRSRGLQFVGLTELFAEESGPLCGEWCTYRTLFAFASTFAAVTLWA